MTSEAPVISVTGLGKTYRAWTHPRPTSLSERIEARLFPARARTGAAQAPTEIRALQGVSFDVARGEVLGVIGPNGAGKSTLLAILARITEPTEGRAEIRGRVSSILEVGTGFHPELTGRDNVFLNGAILGMTRAETAERFDEIVAFSGVRDFIDMPIKRFSSGMYVRLAFAVTAHLDPDVLLLDEVLAVGDRSFQRKCIARIEEMASDGRSVLFVSHDTDAVSRLCDRAIVLSGGEVAFSGPVADAIEHYLDAPQLGSHTAAAEPGGSGLRISHLRVENLEGGAGLVCGGPAVIRTTIAAPAGSPRTVGLELDVRGPAGSTLAGLDVSVPVDAPEIAADCHIEELPLQPGAYTVTAALTPDGEIVDRRIAQTAFALAANRSGPPARPSAAPLLLRHEWSVSPVAGRDTPLAGTKRR